MTTKKALVLLADGAEEMEATISIDVLRRAQITVTVAGVALENKTFAVCSRGVKIIPDVTWGLEESSNLSDHDAIIIPGGAKGAKTLSENPGIQDLIRNYHRQGKVVAMICAGTLAAKASGIALGEKITSHPSVKEELAKDYDYQESRVAVSDNLITSRGPGSTFLFAMTIVEKLVGKEAVNIIMPPLMLPSEL